MFNLYRNVRLFPSSPFILFICVYIVFSKEMNSTNLPEESSSFFMPSSQVADIKLQVSTSANNEVNIQSHAYSFYKRLSNLLHVYFLFLHRIIL